MIYVNARFITQPLTGVQRYAFEVCIQMKKMNPGIIFLSPKNVMQPEWKQVLGVKTIGLLTGHLWEQIELPLYLRRMKRGLLFSPCNIGPLLSNNQCLTVHDVAFKIFETSHSYWFRKWYNFLIPKLCQSARHLFTVSETVKNELISYYHLNPKNISVTYNGIASVLKSKLDVCAPKEKMILTVGSLTNQKNTQFLIEGFLASELVKDYQLIIIGRKNGIFQSISIEPNPKIKWIEDATDTQLIEYYKKAEMACFLSLYEGFGIPVLESLQFHCKVICSDIPAFRELFSGAVSFCSSTDRKALTEMLNRIASIPSPTENSIAQLNSKYDYHVSADTILHQLKLHENCTHT
nr:glycosyltransferase family 4 protein [Chitinophagaceae bacterium]